MPSYSERLVSSSPPPAAPRIVPRLEIILSNPEMDFNMQSELAAFGPPVQGPNVEYFNPYFSNLQWYPTGGTPSLTDLPTPQLIFDNDRPFLPSPATTPEQPTTPRDLHLPFPEPPLVVPHIDATFGPLTPELFFAGGSVINPPAAIIKPTAPRTPLAPVQWPNTKQITDLCFCPYTVGGKICGEVNWTSSANKAIRRHIKAEHIQGTTVWLCPNLVCRSKGHPFKRKDLLATHRKRCNPRNSKVDQGPLLPNIVVGTDQEVQRWMDAVKDLRKEVREKLRAGTPWSIDLLRPVSLPP